jgi:hypothetical protein
VKPVLSGYRGQPVTGSYSPKGQQDRLGAAFAFTQTAEHKQQVAALRSKDAKRARIYTRKRLAEDATFRILANVRTRVRSALKVSGTRKTERTHRLFGCTVQQLCDHLQGQFKPGMSWDNYGQWEIDHVKPCRLFNHRFPSQQRACFHYSNLQPLWKSENRSKSGYYYGEQGKRRMRPVVGQRRIQKRLARSFNVGTAEQSEAIISGNTEQRTALVSIS